MPTQRALSILLTFAAVAVMTTSGTELCSLSWKEVTRTGILPILALSLEFYLLIKLCFRVGRGSFCSVFGDHCLDRPFCCLTVITLAPDSRMETDGDRMGEPAKAVTTTGTCLHHLLPSLCQIRRKGK